MKRRSAVVAAMLLLIAGCGGEESSFQDTDCVDAPLPSDQLRFQSTVFVGTVTAVDGRSATVYVDEVWRGSLIDEEVTIVAGEGRRYESGVRYLFFPENHRDPFDDPACSATTRWDTELAALRPAAAASNPPPIDVSAPWEWYLLLVAIAGVASIGWSWWRRTRRGPEPVWNPDHRIADEFDPDRT